MSEFDASSLAGAADGSAGRIPQDMQNKPASLREAYDAAFAKAKAGN
jgi:hypothetical protein